MTDAIKYDLPDFQIYESKKNTCFLWQPDKVYVVLGTSNKPEDSLITENIFKDKIDIKTRPTGGHAVVLSPETLVISVISNNIGTIAPGIIFRKINTFVIESLESMGVKHLSHKGFSDIAIHEKKILGSSMYRNKEKNFYHAVLNISLQNAIIERYLRHPLKEPDYRKGRNHNDFVTSLKKEGYNFCTEEIKTALHSEFEHAGLIPTG